MDLVYKIRKDNFLKNKLKNQTNPEGSKNHQKPQLL